MSVWNCGLLSGATLLLVMTSHLLPKAKCNEFKLVRVSHSSSFPLTKGLSNISIPNQSLWSGGGRTLFFFFTRFIPKKYNVQNRILHVLVDTNICIFCSDTDEVNKWNARSLSWKVPLEHSCRGSLMEEGERYLLDLSCSSTTTRAGGSRGIEGWRVIEGRNRWTPRVCLLNRPQNEGKYALPWSAATHDTQGCRDGEALTSKPGLKVWMFNVVSCYPGAKWKSCLCWWKYFALRGLASTHICKNLLWFTLVCFGGFFPLNLEPHMPFIPCGFTPARRAHRAADVRQVHNNTGVRLPSHVHALFLCASRARPRTHGWIHRTGGGSDMDRDEHMLGSADLCFQLLDLLSWTSCSHLYSLLSPVAF